MRYTLLIDCSDEVGLVYKITKILFELKSNIEKNSEFVDKDNNKFFMRTEFNANLDGIDLIALLKESLPKDAHVRLTRARKKDIVILATKEAHCLGDILMRYYSDELNANIKAIISNYEILKPLADKFHIPFFTVSHLDLSRNDHEERVLEVLSDIGEIDYIVLAKYMRILSPNFVEKYNEKIINIHHSFLPAFIGANPYKQAFERGVKIIGATAHFVNNNLDEGPIIAQSIQEVNHDYTWRDMQRAGKDVEKIVLAKALSLAFEDRIFVYANKTIIL